MKRNGIVKDGKRAIDIARRRQEERPTFSPEDAANLIRQIDNGDDQMKEMEYSQFLGAVEGIVKNTIRRAHPAAWDEDHITYSIIEQLAVKLRRISIIDFQRPFKALWDPWKLRGTPEKSFGDLGIVVRIQTWEGETIEGVALLEAKKRSLGKNVFEAMRLDQLKRIQSNAPNSRLLLYDYDQIIGFEDNISALGVASNRFLRDWPYGHPHQTAFSHVVALPTSIALVGKMKNSRLYKFSIPFSVQLCSRYLRGYDLEYDPKAVSIVKGFADKYGGMRNLLLIGISTGEEEPSLPDGINQDLYARVG